MSRREHVGIQQHLLGGVRDVLAPRKDRMFLAGLETSDVPVAIPSVGNRGIILLEARDDLLVQRILQRLERRHAALAVGILRAQVLEHLGIRARIVPEPVIRIDTFAVRGLHRVRSNGRNGRF
jgi:hypothetical protein